MPKNPPPAKTNVKNLRQPFYHAKTIHRIKASLNKALRLSVLLFFAFSIENKLFTKHNNDDKNIDFFCIVAKSDKKQEENTVTFKEQK